MRRHHSHADGREKSRRYRDDMEMEVLPPGPLKDKLYDLFGQIEKEFEILYSENLTLRDQVEALMSDKLGEAASCLEKGQMLEVQDSTEYSSKHKKPELSQRIKTKYKQSTSKLVSSFRAPSNPYSLVREFRGHRDGVWEVSVSRAQGHQVIATAAVDHMARIFAIETGTCLLQYTGHRGSVNSVRFHPSQDLVLTSSGDGSAHVWRAQLSQIPDVPKSQSSGDEEVEGSEKEDGETDLIDQTTDSNAVRSAQLELCHHSDVVSAADWMCDGRQLVTSSWDRLAILADAETGEEVSKLSGHDQEINDIHSHMTQRLVLTASKDTTFRLWDFRGSQMMVHVSQGHNQQVTSAVFASGDKVVSGSDDRCVKVWDMRNMRSPTATIRTDSEVNRLSVSQAHNMIAIPHDNRNIRLYDLNGVRVGRLPRNNRLGHSRMVSSVAWADHNSSCNLFSCGFDRKVLGWMVNTQIKE